MLLQLVFAVCFARADVLSALTAKAQRIAWDQATDTFYLSGVFHVHVRTPEELATVSELIRGERVVAGNGAGYVLTSRAQIYARLCEGALTRSRPGGGHFLE